jgi:hypothetical protein
LQAVKPAQHPAERPFSEEEKVGRASASGAAETRNRDDSRGLLKRPGDKALFAFFGGEKHRPLGSGPAKQVVDMPVELLFGPQMPGYPRLKAGHGRADIDIVAWVEMEPPKLADIYSSVAGQGEQDKVRPAFGAGGVSSVDNPCLFGYLLCGRIFPS